MVKRQKPTEPLGAALDSSRLDWNDLSVFLALSRHRNLSETARFLGVNHTTVGRRIQALESQLNQRLFERTRHGFLLTEAGYNLLAHAEGMEQHAHSIALEFTEKSAAPGGIVRLATMEALGSLYIAPRMALLYRQQPSVRVELVTAAHWINLSKREADIPNLFSKATRAAHRGQQDRRVSRCIYTPRRHI